MPARGGLQRLVESFWARALVTALLLGLVATIIDWGAAADQLSEGSWGLFATAVGLLFASQVIAGWRWRFLLEAASVDRPTTMVIRAYLIGAFANSFLPTAFGGDLARSWLVARSGPPLVRALLSVVVDRWIALWCLVAVAWISTAFDPGSVPSSLMIGLLVLTLGGIAASALLLGFAMWGRGRHLSRLPERVLEWAREVRATLRLYGNSPRALAIGVALGLVFQVLVVLAVWLIARAVDIDAPFSLLAVVTPLVLVVTLVPISIAGIGIREGGMVVLLGAADYSATEATVLSLLSFVATALASLPGAAAMLIGHAFPSKDELETAEAALHGVSADWDDQAGGDEA